MNDGTPVLDALARRDVAALQALLPDAPASPDAVAAALGDTAALERIASSDADVRAAFASAVGPLLAAPLCLLLVPDNASSARGAVVLDGIASLLSPPLEQGVVLRRILWLTPVMPDAAASAAVTLEGLYGAMPDDLPESTLEAHALPRALGAAIDLRTMAVEAGAAVRIDQMSLSTPLLMALEQAGVRTAWDLLDAPALAARVTVPAELLAGIAAGLSRVAAIATATRVAVVALLVDPNSLLAREVLLDLFDDRRARVPAGVTNRLGTLALQ